MRFNSNLATKTLNNSLRDRQPKPVAALIQLTSVLREQPKHLEQHRDVLLADPDAGVGHLEFQVLVVISFELANLDCDTTSLCELERVRYQVDQHLLDALAVRPISGTSHRCWSIDREVDVLLCSLEPEDVVDVFEQVAKSKCIDVQLECLCIELRHVEDVFDQVHQQTRRDFADLDELVDPRIQRLDFVADFRSSIVLALDLVKSQLNETQRV